MSLPHGVGPTLPPVRSWMAIPAFSQVQDETTFWETHQLDPAVLQSSIYKAEGGESTSITLRIDPRMLSRIKRLAGKRYLNYQSMIKQWLAERLEREMADGD